jgi:hypothetical protein
MNDHMHTGIAEATRLTQQGRLDEATAAIQRALGGTFAPAAQEDPGDTNEPIEVISRLVRATPQGGQAYGSTPTWRGCVDDPWADPAHPRRATPSQYEGWESRLRKRSRGRTLSRRAFVHKQCRDSLLQTLHPERLHRAGRSPDRHAPWLHPESGRLRYRHAHERALRGAHVPRCVSRASWQRQHAEVLELIPGRTSNVVGANRRSLLASRDRW